MDLKNIVYQETDPQDVAKYELAKMQHHCIKWMELYEASDIDLVCYKSLQKFNEDYEKLRASLKDLDEAMLPIARLLVSHVAGEPVLPLVDRVKEAPGCLATYVKHMAKSIPNQVPAFLRL
jgi:hypothetical protein